jgi:Zn-dependent protease
MTWSWTIARFFGIHIRMHWTFLLLLAWVFIAHLLAEDSSVLLAIEGVLFVCAIFVCVILHEFGHALTARRFDVQTRDIILLPIGGVARLKRIPETWWQELLIAVAGPAVNIVIALILLAALLAAFRAEALTDFQWVGGGVKSELTKLLWVNVLLVAFNALPAFPMDGGRVLRALLASRMPHVRATHIAARVGQFMAIVFAVFGLFYNWFLLFIALFVYLGAQAEAQFAEVRSAFRNVRVGDAMVRQFQKLDVNDTLDRAVQLLLNTSQQDFPVIENGEVVGVLYRAALVETLSQKPRDTPVTDVMSRDCPTVHEDDSVERAYQRMNEEQCTAMVVLDDHGPAGLLTRENLMEWLMIHSATTRRHEQIDGAAPPTGVSAARRIP